MQHFLRYALLSASCVLAMAGAARGQTGQKALPPGGGNPTLPTLEPENHYTFTVDSLLQHVDKTQIPTGLLYDRAMPLARLDVFGEGVVDTSSYGHFKQAYLELRLAAYSRSGFPFSAYQIGQRAERMARHDSVAIGLLDYRFNLIDTLAFQDNLLQVQNGLYADVPGRSRSPYRTRTVAVAAALASTVPQNARFYLDPRLWLRNTGRSVTSLSVDFGNGGGYGSYAPGQLVPVYYYQPGLKVLRFTLHFSDGSSAQAAAQVQVITPSPQARYVEPAGLNPVTATIPFQDYDSNLSFYGVGNVAIDINNVDDSETQLNAPVIILDGFDPDSKTGLRDLYTKDIPPQLIQGLQMAQRDLVILDFPKTTRQSTSGVWREIDGGADYIERNAMVLVRLIQLLKPRLKNPNDKFTIIGPSMGGLISRYALAYMERQFNNPSSPNYQNPAYDHRTALWVSFDAPHQGANIPMGDQEFLRYYKDLTETAQTNLEIKMNSVAARQMLVHHYSARSEAPAGAPGFRDRFMTALRDNGLSPSVIPGTTESYGYPVNLRRVAIVNGRLDGGLSGGSTCGRALEMDIFLRTRGRNSRRRLFFLGLNPGAMSWANVNFTGSANDLCQVFEGRVHLLMLPYSGYQIPLRRRTNVRSGPQGSYDLAPGGTYNAQQIIQEATEEGDDGEFYDAVFGPVVPRHSFIPTVSALGYQYRSMASYQSTASLPNAYANLLNGNLVCNDETPFDAYYGPEHTNTAHISGIDNAGLAFLQTELLGQTQAPVFTQGPLALCSGTATYNVATECGRQGSSTSPYTYTWTLTGAGAQFVGGGLQRSGQGLSSVQIETTGVSSEAYLSVVAQRPGAAPSPPAYRTIRIGDSEPNLYPSSIDPVCVGTMVELRAYLPLGSTSVSFRVDNGNPMIQAYDPATGLAHFAADVPRYAGRTTLHIDYTAPCTGAARTTFWDFDAVEYDRNGTRCPLAQDFITAYPNPADSYVLVSAPEASRAGSSPAQAELYNSRGKLVQTVNLSLAQTRLATTELPEGLYHMVLRTGAEVKHYNLQIKH